MSYDVPDSRLEEIIKNGQQKKEQAVADLDYEEAALWRDAVLMAREVIVFRAERGSQEVSYSEVAAVANRKEFALPSFTVAMAKELKRRMDEEEEMKWKAGIRRTWSELNAQSTAADETQHAAQADANEAEETTRRQTGGQV